MLRSFFSKIKSPRVTQIDDTTEQLRSSPVSEGTTPNSTSAIVQPVPDRLSTFSHNVVINPPQLPRSTQGTSVLPNVASSSHNRALSRLNCLRQWRHDLAVLRHKLSVYIDAVDAVAAAGISLGRSGKALSTDVTIEGTTVTAPPAPVSCRCDASPCSCWAAHAEALEAFHASLAVSVRCAWESLREAAKGEGAGVAVGGGGGVMGAGASIGAGVGMNVDPRTGQAGAGVRRDSEDAGRACEGEGVVGTVRAFHDAHGDMVLATIAAREGIHRLGGLSENVPTEGGVDFPSACGAPRTLALFPPARAWPSGVWARRTHAYVEAWEEELRECEALVVRGTEEEQLAARAIERVNELLIRRAEAMEEEVEEDERRQRQEADVSGTTIPAIPSALSDVSLSTFVDTALRAVPSPTHMRTVGAPSAEALAAGGAWSLDDEAVLRHAKAVLAQVMKSAEDARARTDRAWARVCVHGVRARELSVLLARAVAAVWRHAGLGAVAEEEGAGWAGVGAGVGVSVGLGAANSTGSGNGGRLRWLGPGGSDDDSEEAEESERGRAQAYAGGGAQAVFNSLFNATAAPRPPSAGWPAPPPGSRGVGPHTDGGSGSDSDGEGVGVGMDTYARGRGSASDDSSVGVLLSPARVPKSAYYNQLYRQLSHTRARTRARTQSSAHPHLTPGDAHDARGSRKNSLEYPQRRISQAGKPGDGVSGSVPSERVERGETLVERVARLASAASRSAGMGGFGARSIFRADDVLASASSDEWESDEWESEEGWGEAEDAFWLEGEREGEGARENVGEGDVEPSEGPAADALVGAEAKSGAEAAVAGLPEVSATAASSSIIPPAPVIAGLNDVPPNKSTIPPAPLFSEIYGPDVPIPVISPVGISKSGIPPAPILSGMSGIPPPPSLASLGIPPPPALAGLGIPPPPHLGVPPVPTLSMFPAAAPQAPWERLGLRAPLTLPGGGRGLRRLHWEVVGDVERAVGSITKGAVRGAEVDEVAQLLLRAFRVCVVGAEDADVAVPTSPRQPRRTASTDTADHIGGAEADEARTGTAAGVGIAQASVQLAKHALTTALGPDALAGAEGTEGRPAEEKAEEREESVGVDSLWRRVQLLRVEEECLERALEDAKSRRKQCTAAVDEKRDTAAHDEKREGVHDDVADTTGVDTDRVADTSAAAAASATIETDADERRSGCLSLLGPLLATMPPHVAHYVRGCVQVLPPAVCAELGQLSVVSLGTLAAEDRWVNYEAAAARIESCGREGCGAVVEDSVLRDQCLQARARARARASRGEPAVCVEVSTRGLLREVWAAVEALMAAAPLTADVPADACAEAACAALARAWTLPFMAEADAKVRLRAAGVEVGAEDSEAHVEEGTEKEADIVASVVVEPQEVGESAPSASPSLSAAASPSPYPYPCLCAARWATQLRTLLLVGLVRRTIAMQRQQAPCGSALLCGVVPVAEQIMLAFDVERARARREKAKKRETMAMAAKEEAICLLGPKRGYTLAIAARGLRPLTPLSLVQLLLAADVGGISGEGEDGDGGVWGAWAASEPAVDAFLRDEEDTGDADASLLLQGVLCEYSEHMAHVEREAEEGDEAVGRGMLSSSQTVGLSATSDGDEDEDDTEECYLSPLARRQPYLRHLRLRLTPAHASILLTLADMLARASALLPADGEAELLNTYTGPLSEVAAGEQLALAAARERAVAVHVRVLDAGRDAAVTAREVCVGALGVARACVEVMGSTALTALSRVVLDLGNAVNTGTKAGGASAVRCSVWERVAVTRTADGKQTMIEYIGDLCLTTCPRALRLATELPSLRQWATVDGAGMHAKVETLRTHATLIAAVLVHYFVSALPLHALAQNTTDTAEGADESSTTAISDGPATVPNSLDGMLTVQGDALALVPELSRAVAVILASAEGNTDADRPPVNPDIAVKLHTLARTVQRHCRAGDLLWSRARVPGQPLRLQPVPQQLCRRLLALHSHVARVATLAHTHLLLASRCVAAASAYLCERPPAPNAWHLCVCGLCACVELLQAQWAQARERAWRRMRARRREVDGWISESRQSERVVEGAETATTVSSGEGGDVEATVGGRDRNVSVGGVMARMRRNEGLQRRLRQVTDGDEGE